MTVDKQILIKCAKNNSRAQHKLYKIVYESLMRIGLRYCRNEEEAVSVLNDSFIKILKNLKKFIKNEPIDKFEPWARRITINTAIDYYRQNIKNDYLSDSIQLNEDYMHGMVNSNEYETIMNIEQMDAMLKDFSDLNRAVFNLFVIDGYSHKEICEKIGITETSSRKQISFVRKKLQLKAQKVIFGTV